MFFTQVTLNKKSWHFLLLKVCMFGDRYIPKYNFCPYFWMVIFFLMISPVYLLPAALINLTMLALRYIDKINYSLRVKAKNKILKEIDSGLLDRQIFYGRVRAHADYCYYSGVLIDGELFVEFGQRGKYGIPSKYEDLFYDWMDDCERKGQDWLVEFAKIETRIKEQREFKSKLYAGYIQKLAVQAELDNIKEEARAAKREAFQKRMRKIINGIVKYTQWVVYIIIPIVGFFTVGYFIRGIIWVYDSITMERAAAFSVGLILAACGFIFIYILNMLPKWLGLLFDIKIPAFVSRPLMFLWTIIKTIFMGLFGVCKFFYYYFMAWKNNNCPEIIWDDEK